MENKNINSGNIDSAGGSVNIGDTTINTTNNITYVIDGVVYLLSEYREQLKDIERLIKTFKPSTALGLLEQLEARLATSEIPPNNKIKARLLFLKGQCKKDLRNCTTADVSKDFIEAYKLEPENRIFALNALAAYYNIKNNGKLLELVDSILTEDESNPTAWFFKMVLSKEYLVFLRTVPQSVLESLTFQIYVGFQLIKERVVDTIEQIEKFGITFNVRLEKYVTLQYEHLEAWDAVISIYLSDFLCKCSKYPLLNPEFTLKSSTELEELIRVLKAYISTLHGTEVTYALPHHQFYFYKLMDLLNGDGKHAEEIKQAYCNLPKNFWPYTSSFCQVLLRRQDFGGVEAVLKQYEESGGDRHADYLGVKFLALELTGNVGGQRDAFEDYLLHLDLIDEANVFNILGPFIRNFSKTLSSLDLQRYYEVLTQKHFPSAELELLFKVTFQIRYLDNFSLDEVYSILLSLKAHAGFGLTIRGIIAENLNKIGKRGDAIAYLETFIAKDEITELLHFYIKLLYAQLVDKDDTEKGRYKELLSLLKFWRENSSIVDRQFLIIEHNLYTEIRDSERLLEVNVFLYSKFPNDEECLNCYLHVLEIRQDIEEISRISESIPMEFENERYGAEISCILLRNGVKDKGFDILYGLARKRQNSLARSTYFSATSLFPDKLIYYNEVVLGSWVAFQVDDKKDKIQITRSDGYHGEFLKRKPGEIFSTTVLITRKFVKVEVLEIFNDAINLVREIVEDAKNPLNDLGIHSIDVPNDGHGIIEAITAQLGVTGMQHKETSEECLRGYYKYQYGFTEVCNRIYNSKQIDCYNYLTLDRQLKFMTLPQRAVRRIDVKTTEGFILDGSTLVLFYNLHKELGFDPKHTFLISILLKNEIERDLMNMRTPPSAKMSVDVTLTSFQTILIPDDYKQNRINYLEWLLKWIDKYCKVDLVEEKLDLIPKIRTEKEYHNKAAIDLLTDHMHFSTRENHRLISSDSSLLTFLMQSGIHHNIVNPETYCLTYFPEQVNTEFYGFLLRSNYIGITITLDTLRKEFFDFLSGRDNYYMRCLENIRYSLHNDPSITVTISKFLKELYLMSSLRSEDKARHAYQVTFDMISGMHNALRLRFVHDVKREFYIMGNMQDEVLTVINSVFKMYDSSWDS